MSDIIRIEQLNLYYEKHHALKNIGLTIQEKAVTAFIGPSGCGKSTLLRTLNRMNDMIPGTRIEGKVEIAGSDIYGDDVEVEDLRQQVGMVFQQPNPFPKSIYENVAYGPRLQGITSKTELNEIVERSLRQSALWEEVKDYLKKSALSLSGGQQQRLCIARAIASQPDILLMDEATSALDPISTLKIEELTQDLKKDYTIVMVTHNMHQAARISDQTAFFLNGEVIESTDTTEMFSNPTDSRTEDYISGRFG
ncbi:phosphate ABC transporter ATP-binding protein PstB [Paenibacillus sp. Z6-24]